MRGNLRDRASDTVVPGSIPACAGEPDEVAWQGIRAAVYPRVCGGAKIGRPAILRSKGLSPRVRGSPNQHGILSECAGSIPACAGEPTARSYGTPPTRVYPRVCGGARALLPERADVSGLSPRVRGSPDRPWACAVTYRSIPACAGEPHHLNASRARARVYPRVCGGALGVGLQPCERKGLSPRVRGSRHDGGGEPGDQGSIPACAGEPGVIRVAVCPRKVYPRVCGGARTSTCRNNSGSGLSPRVRGSLCRRRGSCSGRRSIPACAGEPCIVDA